MDNQFAEFEKQKTATWIASQQSKSPNLAISDDANSTHFKNAITHSPSEHSTALGETIATYAPVALGIYIFILAIMVFQIVNPSSRDRPIAKTIAGIMFLLIAVYVYKTVMPYL